MAEIIRLADHQPKHRRPSPAPLFPAGDPLSPPDPAWHAWFATASPEDRAAEMACRSHIAKLYSRLGLSPRNPAKAGMVLAIVQAASAP